ncbi:hypothetical protein F2981_04600 [Sinorhizobium meliloti]|nr:hypothetical protein [Sinorhizobium meliloti]
MAENSLRPIRSTARAAWPGAEGDVLAAVARHFGSGCSRAGKIRPARRHRRKMPLREERVKMTRLRQTIARRLKDAQNTGLCSPPITRWT